MPITRQQKEQLSEIMKNVGGVEVARIAGAIYDTFASANMPLTWERLMALSNRMFFAHQPWSRLPVDFNDVKVALFRSVEEKLLAVLPELFTLVEDEAPVQEEISSPTSSTSLQQQVVMPGIASGGTVAVTTPENTSTTRSKIDELDEDASMHGMDTESPPEGGVAPDPQEVKTQAIDDDSTEMEIEGQGAGQEDEEEEEVAASSESNGHNPSATPTSTEDAPVTETVVQPT
jgi:hypothetical protein